METYNKTKISAELTCNVTTFLQGDFLTRLNRVTFNVVEHHSYRVDIFLWLNSLQGTYLLLNSLHGDLQ